MLRCRDAHRQEFEDQGKYEEAESIYRQTLAQKEIVFGLEHPSIQITVSNLTGLLSSQRKYEEAELMNRS